MAGPRVTIFNEFLHEVEHDAVRAIYPDGIHMTLKRALEERLGADVTTATLREKDNGLPQSVIDATDVMLWWGHKAHAAVLDQTAERVKRAVLDGMGLIVLHSGHLSKPFVGLMGTHGSLSWREADEKERLWNLQPAHPIMRGTGRYFELQQEEMYGERFDVPESYGTSNQAYTLLYSTVGYELAGPKRALIRQNDVEAAVSEGLAFAWRVVDDGGGVRLEGRAAYSGTGWGFAASNSDTRAGRSTLSMA